MLLGVLSTQTDVRHLQAFTFGTEGSDDVRIARLLARKLGVPHNSMPLPEDYLLRYAQMGVRITDGMDSCIHIHSLANLNTQAQEVDLLFTGYYSDALADTDAQREWFAQFDDETSLKLHWSFMHRLFVTDADETIFTPDFLAVTRDPFDQEFRSTAMRLKHGTMLAWLDAVELAERQRRLTQFGNDLLRWRVVCRTPFTDADFVDFCLALPPGLRLERFLFTQALIQHFPDLAKVPNDRTGRPFLVDMRYVSQQALYNLRYILYRRGLAAEPRHRRRLYANYDRWFRTALRPWVEDTLLDKRTLQRGILQPTALQRIVQEHMSGQANRTRELGMLLSLELWLRSYMD
jgi:asparagine synthetase B (glutamine-hydrolysing)